MNTRDCGAHAIRLGACSRVGWVRDWPGGHGRRALRQGTDAAIAALEERSRLYWTEQRRLASTLALLKHLPVRQMLVGSLKNPCTVEQADVTAFEHRCQAPVELPALVDDAARTCVHLLLGQRRRRLQGRDSSV